MFRMFGIAALALCASCQSVPGVKGCFDQGHITSVSGDSISFCTAAELSAGDKLEISVGNSGPPRRGSRSSVRTKVGAAVVLSRSAEGVVQARITSGYARVGAHASP